MYCMKPKVKPHPGTPGLRFLGSLNIFPLVQNISCWFELHATPSHIVDHLAVVIRRILTLFGN